MKGVQLNLSLFNILRTDLINDFDGYYVDKKWVIKVIAFFNYHLNTYENFFIKLKIIIIKKLNGVLITNIKFHVIMWMFLILK